MIRGWIFGLRKSYGPREFLRTSLLQQRTERQPAKRRPLFESLETRCVLTATAAAEPELLIDTEHQPTSLLVQFREDADHASSLRAYAAGTVTDQSWEIAPGLREVQLAPGQDIEDALAAYEGDANVVYAEPDYRVKLNAFLPNDPSFPTEQWGLNNTGQIYGIPGFDIRAPAAWEVSRGDGIVVAVIDTGIDYTHPDLADNMWKNPNEIPDNQLDDDFNGYVDDVYGYDFANRDGDPMDDYFHGTHVAGTVAAVTDNAIGVAGVAPNAKLMALKFLDAEGTGLTSDAISALNYAVAMGAQISNNSWGGGPSSQVFRAAIAQASSAGHIFVAAAGNYGNNNDAQPFYPASYEVPNVISVAATDIGDHIAYFSNYGKLSVDVGAPGVDIYSTLPTFMTPGMIDEGIFENYGSLSGTSMAAPHVAGVLALLLSQNSGMLPEDAIAQIKDTVDPVPSLLTKSVSGGRVNAAVALGILPEDTTPPRITSSDPTGVVTGPVSQVTITFSEPIDPGSFDFSDIMVFDGPQGAMSILSIEQLPTNDRKFAITFDPQTEPGAYTLLLGPHMADRAGFELDQDGDGVGGVDGLDEFSASFIISDSPAGGYASPNVPIGIRGFDQFVSFLTIEEDLPIADVNVRLNLNFPRVGNLHVWLVSPGGTVVDLSKQNGENAADFLDTIFDDEADFAINEGVAPFTGSYRPDDALAVLNNENAIGTWQLVVQNVSAVRNRGTLNSWSLDILPGESTGGGHHEINDPPVVGNDSYSTEQNVPLVIQEADLLSNDSDPNDDPLTITSVGNPVGGTVEQNSDGTITFYPDPGSLAPGRFQYVVYDGLDNTVGTVTIAIRPPFNLHNGVDVNDDTFVSPIDSLLVINYINAFGSAPIIGLGVGATSRVYYDVVPDNVIAPNDVLAVINYINAHPRTSAASAGEGEGLIASADESSSSSRLDATTVDLLLSGEGGLALDGAPRGRTGRRG